MDDVTAPRQGGRGARERILAAAARLFYQHGIHATGIAALTSAAHVSTRTFYQHFASKDALVEAYLRRYATDAPLPVLRELSRDDLPPAQRLLAIFDTIGPGDSAVVRGCPFHNAAVEAAGEMPDVTHLVQQYKQAFQHSLIRIAAEAGAADPEGLGRQLAVLYEGATALATSCDDVRPVSDAKTAAATLVAAALAPAPGR